MPDSADESDLTQVPLFRLQNSAETDQLWNLLCNYDPDDDWWAAFNSVLNWNCNYEAPCTLVILVVNELDVPLAKDDWAETGGYAWHEPVADIPGMADGMPGMGIFAVDEGSTYGPIGAIHFAPQTNGLPQGLTIAYRTHQLKSSSAASCFVQLTTNTASAAASWFWENAKMDGSDASASATIATTDTNGNAMTTRVDSVVQGKRSPSAAEQSDGTSEYFIYTMIVRVRYS